MKWVKLRCFLSCYFLIHSNTITPNLPTKKVNVPRSGGRMLLLKPPDRIEGFTLPFKDSIASKAFTKPNIKPKKPKTNANKLIAFKSFVFFSELSLKLLIKKKILIKSKISNETIKNGPPSLIKFIIFKFKILIKSRSKKKLK